MEYVTKKGKHEEYIEKYFEDAKTIIDNLSREDISKVIDILIDARNTGKKVFICGNGGSASAATHMACDFFKWAYQNQAEVKEPLWWAMISNISTIRSI